MSPSILSPWAQADNNCDPGYSPGTECGLFTWEAQLNLGREEYMKNLGGNKHAGETERYM